METTFFKTRAELTGKMQECINNGLTCYRVRVACECKPQLLNPTMYPKNNQRNGVLVIDGNTVVYLYIRCKYCSKQPEN